MKYSLLFVLLLGVFILTAQTVPNGGFETWTQTGNYAEPTPWNSPNPTTASLSLYTVTRESSVVQSGAYAAKLQTKSFLGLQIPGLLTLGTFNINLVTMEATITGGTPFTWRPDSLTGYIQYEPKFSDECFIGVLLLKQNGSSWDTLGTGSFTTTATLLSWTRFIIPIDYTSTETPTHLNIIILSSDRDNPQPNSTLYIDNLSFIYNPATISETSESKPHIKFFNDRLMVESSPFLKLSGSVRIFTLDGRVYFSDQIPGDAESYVSPSLSNLPTGVYLVALTDRNGNRYVTKIFR